MRIDPVRIAQARLGSDGRVDRTGDWIDYHSGQLRMSSALAFDCFEPDATGIPTDGLYGVDCGYGSGRWFFGSAYCNAWVTNDMQVIPGAAGAQSLRVEFAFYWAPVSPEQCYVFVTTAEDFDDTCVGPDASSFYSGVLYDFDVLPEIPGNYYYADIDLTPYGLHHQLPFDGSGAYLIAWAQDITSGGSLVLPTCSQPMLWGTKPLGPGTQGPIQWDDDGPADYDHTPPAECYSYDYGLCPDPLGAMACFYYTIGDCNRNGVDDAQDIVNGTSADVDGNGVPDECEFAIQFSQIDWLKAPGVFNLARSDWGEVTLEFTSADGARMYPHPDGGLYAWVNIVTRSNNQGPANWAVRNYPIRARDGAWLDTLLPTTIWYDLRVSPGTPVTMTDYIVRFSPAPLEAMPSTGWVYGEFAGRTEIVRGGLAFVDPVLGLLTGGTGKGVPPLPQNFVGAVQAQDKPKDTGSITTPEKGIEGVNEELQGCAPGAVGRSLRYLDLKNNDINFGADAQGIYEILKNALHMATDIGADGVGTYPDKVVQGKKKYVLDKKLRVDIYTKTSQKLAEMAAYLNDGLDVEILIWWGKGRDGKSLGGHAAFVSKIVVVRDDRGEITGFTVTVIDDKKQGDGKKGANSHTLEFDANGNLKGFGDGARLISFIAERVEPVAPEDPKGRKSPHPNPRPATK